MIAAEARSTLAAALLSPSRTPVRRPATSHSASRLPSVDSPARGEPPITPIFAGRSAGGKSGGDQGNAVRHSVAFFANPTYYAPVECFPYCCAPAKGMPPPQYEATTAGKYISGRLGLMYKEPRAFS